MKLLAVSVVVEEVVGVVIVHVDCCWKLVSVVKLVVLHMIGVVMLLFQTLVLWVTIMMLTF